MDALDLDQHRALVAPFEEAEGALVRSIVQLPRWLPERDEDGLRYALNLARVTRLRTPSGEELELEEPLATFRAEVAALACPPLRRPGGPDRAAVAQVAPLLAARAREARAGLLARLAGRLPPGALDREVCEKALVVVGAGGGGVSWVFLGAFELLEQYGLAPRLLAGTSMGAVLLLLRARRPGFDAEELVEGLARVPFRSLFRFLEVESRYALPGAIRLYLRAGIGGLLRRPDGGLPALGQLPIPLLVSVAGIRAGALPHDPAYYEHLLDLHGRSPRPHLVKRLARDLVGALTELLAQRDRFSRLALGADPATREFDALDAVGFSSALPGLIHYDVARPDERMHALLGELFRRHDLFRLMDGGIVDNLPARAAAGAVRAGRLGTRNAFVLGLDGFAPKLSLPLWYSVAQLVAQNVARSRPFVHHLRSFQKVLSPVELLPAAARLRRAIQWGKEELLPDMPFVARMVRPFPPLA